jgi:hypothetical protein
LKQLNWIASWVIENNLRAARPGNDIVAKVNACPAESIDFRREVIDDEMNTVPTARSRVAAIRHRTPGRASRSAQQETQITASDISEGGECFRDQGEAEMASVKVEGRLDVVDHIADVDGGHRSLPSNAVLSTLRIMVTV